MTAMTKREAVDAAMSVAQDVADGRLSPADLEATAVAELRELVGTVVGPDDACWTLQCEIARQAVGLGALSPDELREWAAVLDRQRGVEPSEPPAPHEDLSAPAEAASVALSPDYGATEVEPDPDPVGDVEPELLAVLDPLEPKPKPQRPADGYDALRGWSPGGSRRI